MSFTSKASRHKHSSSKVQHSSKCSKAPIILLIYMFPLGPLLHDHPLNPSILKSSTSPHASNPSVPMPSRAKHPPPKCQALLQSKAYSKQETNLPCVHHEESQQATPRSPTYKKECHINIHTSSNNLRALSHVDVHHKIIKGHPHNMHPTSHKATLNIM